MATEVVRQIVHYNVTAHPTAEWTLQQFREALPGDHPYRFVIHDRDSIFAEEVDKGLANLDGILRMAEDAIVAAGELPLACWRIRWRTRPWIGSSKDEQQVVHLTERITILLEILSSGSTMICNAPPVGNAAGRSVQLCADQPGVACLGW